jgi:hypothetical protein
VVQTNEREEPAEEQPNWVDKWTLYTNIGTFAVLTATLLAVIVYVCEMRAANRLTRQAIEVQSRPYIKIIPDYPSNDSMFHPQANKPLQMKVLLFNKGKLPTRIRNRSVVIYSREHLDNPQLPQDTVTMDSCISNVLYFNPVGHEDATGGKWEAVGAAAAAGNRSARGRARAG